MIPKISLIAGEGWGGAGQWCSRSWTTSALPPPRRTGSAAASTRPWPRNSSPVAAPISAFGVNFCPYRPAAPAAPAEARNAGSASPCPRPGCAGRARRRDRVGQRVAEVDPVDQDLQHGGDDRGAAGRAERRGRAGRRAARSSATCCCAAACRRPAGSGRATPGVQRREVEVGHLVVEQEARGPARPCRCRRSARSSACTRRRRPSLSASPGASSTGPRGRRSAGRRCVIVEQVGW